MPIVPIPTSQINDWNTFHSVFEATLGFPDYYGRNMNAWNDCLTFVDDPDAMMVGEHVLVGSGDVLTLQLDDADDFKRRCPEQYDALIECSGFVNWRRIEAGQRPILILSFYVQ